MTLEIAISPNLDGRRSALPASLAKARKVCYDPAGHIDAEVARARCFCVGFTGGAAPKSLGDITRSVRNR